MTPIAGEGPRMQVRSPIDFANKWLRLILAMACLFAVAAIGSPQARAQNAWSGISCTESWISMAGMQKCYRGPDDHASRGFCLFRRYSAFGGTGAEIGYALAFIRASSSRPGCFVKNDPNFATDFRTTLVELKNHATHWSGITRVGDVTGMYFDYPQRHCFAFYVPGPPWTGGYQWTVRGYVCGAPGKAALSTAEIEQFVPSIEVHPQ